MSEPVDVALAAWASDPGARNTASVYAGLVDAVVLLPTRAALVSEQVLEATGLRAEKEAELSLVTVTLGDGRTVLPVFTSPEALRHWRIDARPVRAPVRDVCRSVLDEGWAGLVVDPGTHDFVVPPSATTALAGGFLPVAGDEALSVGELDGDGVLPVLPVTAPAAVLAALRRAVAREPAVAAAWLLRVDPELRLGLQLKVPVEAPGLATITARVGRRLGDQGLSVVVLDDGLAAAASVRCPQVWPDAV
jgi:hypothetical protein